MGKKRVPAKATVGAGETPGKLRELVLRAPTSDRESCRPLWSFALVDHEFDDEWGWPLLGDDVSQVLKFLADIEKCTWREIRLQSTPSRAGMSRAKHHGHSISALPNKARQRLSFLQLDDVDEVFRFRLTSRGRLWGIQVPNSEVFAILWWDPDHRVYPVET